MADPFGRGESTHVPKFNDRLGSAMPHWNGRVHDKCHLLFEPLDVNPGCNLVRQRVDRIVLQRSSTLRRNLPVPNIG